MMSTPQLKFHGLTDMSLRSNHALAPAPIVDGVTSQYVHAAPGFVAFAFRACGVATAIRIRMKTPSLRHTCFVGSVDEATRQDMLHQYWLTQTKMLYWGDYETTWSQQYGSPESGSTFDGLKV